MVVSDVFVGTENTLLRELHNKCGKTCGLQTEAIDIGSITRHVHVQQPNESLSI